MIKGIANIVLNFLYNYLYRPGVKSLKVSRNAKIGKGATIGEKAVIDLNSEVGNYTYVGPYTSITKAKIWNYCSIASFVKIGHGEHKTKQITTSSIVYNVSYEELTKEDCIIGNDVWIGTDVIILRGVKIGDGAIIGANAVVNKDIPDYGIAVGVPAKTIKKRFPDEIEKIIKETQWWNNDLQEAQNLIIELEQKIDAEENNK